MMPCRLLCQQTVTHTTGNSFVLVQQSKHCSDLRAFASCAPSSQIFCCTCRLLQVQRRQSIPPTRSVSRRALPFGFPLPLCNGTPASLSAVLPQKHPRILLLPQHLGVKIATSFRLWLYHDTTLLRSSARLCGGHQSFVLPLVCWSGLRFLRSSVDGPRNVLQQFTRSKHSCDHCMVILRMSRPARVPSYPPHLQLFLSLQQRPRGKDFLCWFLSGSSPRCHAAPPDRLRSIPSRTLSRYAQSLGSNVILVSPDSAAPCTKEMNMSRFLPSSVLWPSRIVRVVSILFVPLPLAFQYLP